VGANHAPNTNPKIAKSQANCRILIESKYTNKRPVKFLVTPHALKLPKRAEIVTAVVQMKAGGVRSEFWSRRRRGPSRPRRRRAALRFRSLDCLAPS
jgi:hypothetical protein